MLSDDTALEAPILYSISPKMKPISILLLLCSIIAPAYSQAQAAADKKLSGVKEPTHSADVIPFACSTSNILIADQLSEIKNLQARGIPVTHDLAGYFYAVVKGRQQLGCPDENPFSVHEQNSTSVSTLSKRASSNSSEMAEVTEMLCKPARALSDEVMAQINVLKKYEFPIPDYLAGWWSVTRDADKWLKCGFQNTDIGPVSKSTEAE